MASWVDALPFRWAKLDAPKLTNREASGFIQFARAVVRAHQQTAQQLTPWDWYPFALPALGWSKPGDKFKVDVKHQLQPYSHAAQLAAAMLQMARELDAAGIEYRTVVDPRGTEKTYRQLASDAWAAMKQLGHESSAVPVLAPAWVAQAGPAAATAAAASAAPGAAAAAKPPGVKEPEQIPLPGVEPPMKAQPVPALDDVPGGGGPTMAPPSKGGGAGMLVVLAALALGGKKRGGKRSRR